MKPFSSNGAPSAPLAAKHRNLRSLLILAVLVAGASLSAFGQEATVVGTVTDPSGSVIPNVAINITSSDTGITRSVTSNDAGQYVAPDLPIGHYNLKAEASGFKVAEKTGVVLNVGDRTRIDFALTLGATKETITVEANAVRVQSDSGEVSDVITGQQVTQLATNGRSMYTLEALTPGASSLQMDFQVPTSAGGDANVSFNGLREGHNIFLIDGGEDDDRGGGGGSSVMPSMDAIAEFRTLTSNYSAEYGLSSAATITSVIKSGSRQFHAAAWEFDRNDAFDARNYFNAAPAKIAELRFNTYGFNGSGPVEFKPSDNPKTFFFYNMEWRSLVQGGSYNQTVPLPSTYGGNFGGTLIKVPTAAQLSPAQQARFTADGLTLGGPFPNNTIPTNLLDANAQALLTAGIFPAPTNGAQFQGTPASPTNVREEIARVDHTFNEKFSIYGHFIAEQVSQGYGTTQWSGDNVPTVGNTFGNPSYSYVIHTTYAISPTLLNEASFNYNGNRIHIIPDGLVTAPSAYAFNRVFSGPDVDSRIPSIDLNGSTGTFYTSNWTPWNNTADDYQLRDDLSWTKGAHQIKYGFSWALYKKVQDLFATTQGNFNFNGQYTGNDFADFLLGYAQGYNEAAVKDSGHWNNVSWAAYVQDNWRATHRLTLNLGLRWDGVPHTYEANNRMSNFYPSLYNPSTPPVFNPDGSISSSSPDLITSANPILAGIQFYGNGIGIAGRNGISNGLVENHWAAFGPRIGFAYDLTGQGKTVLRGGFGIMYERIQGNDMYDSGSNIPFSESVNFNNILLDNPKTNVQTGQTINPAITVASITGMSSAQYQLPVSNQYSLGIQQALGPNSVLSVSYVGNQNRHQNFFQEANLPNPGLLPAIQAGTAGPYNQLVPYLGFNDIRLAENEANSHYNSLQVELHARVAKDLTLQTAYTYAKAIDPTTGGGNSFDLDNVSNPYAGWKYDNGPSIFDRTNVAFVNFVYDIPFLKNSDSHLLKATVGGWEVSGIVTMESGAPLNVGLTGSNITSIIPESSNRPNLTGTISYPHTVNEWFNPAAFSDPAPGTWGDLGHDALRGPGRDNWNLALFKSFLISEARGSRLEIRAESFNTWNHTQFEGNVQGGGISTNLGASNFGAVTSAYDPRVFQFGGKLLF
jgi:hypothetical protein